MRPDAPRRLAALLVLALALASPTASAVPLEGDGGPRWQQFVAALKALEQGQRQTPLRILQFGDSHTAGDHFSHALRAGLQARFGDGGAGWLQPGKVRYYRSSQVLINQSEGWDTRNSFGDKERKAGTVPYGLGGFSNLTSRSGERVDYELKERPAAPRGPVRVEVFYQGNNNALQVVADGELQPGNGGDGSPGSWQRASHLLPAWPARFSVLNQDEAALAIAGTVLEGTQPGVVLDSIGIAGARAEILLEWKSAALASQFGGRDYELILLAFGTNEAFHPRFAEDSYRDSLLQTVDRLQQLAPRAALVLVAPPDAQRRSAACSAPVGKKQHKPEPTSCSVQADAHSCVWEVHPNLATVRQVQRDVARQRQLLYWDWSAVMGGSCGNHRWGQAEPRQALPDHVHLSNVGYAASGEALLGAILQRYATDAPR